MPAESSYPIGLGRRILRLLEHFMRNQGRVYSRDQLLDSVWGDDVYVGMRTVDVHIRRLRKAINVTGGPDVIRTVRSMGYAFDAKAQSVRFIFSLLTDIIAID